MHKIGRRRRGEANAKNRWEKLFCRWEYPRPIIFLLNYFEIENHMWRERRFKD
jgi:hypothetical protein